MVGSMPTNDEFLRSLMEELCELMIEAENDTREAALLVEKMCYTPLLGLGAGRTRPTKPSRMRFYTAAGGG